MMDKRRFAELLVAGGFLKSVQVQDALRLHKKEALDKDFGKWLVAEGLLSPRELARVLGEMFHLDVVDLELRGPEAEALALVGQSLAERLGILPLSIRGTQLTVAVSDPLDFSVPKALGIETRKRVQIMIAPPEEIQVALRQAYQGLKTYSVSVGEPPQKQPEPVGMGYRERIQHLLRGARSQKATELIFSPGPRGLGIFIKDQVSKRLLTTLSPAQMEEFYLELWQLLKVSPPSGLKSDEFAAHPLVGGEPLRMGVRILPTLQGLRVLLVLEGVPSQPLSLLSRPFSRTNLERTQEILALPGGGILLVLNPPGVDPRGLVASFGAELGLSDKTQILIETGSPGLLEGFVQVPLGQDLSMADAIKSAQNQEPDAILLSELRGRAEALAVLEAALSGIKVIVGLQSAQPLEALEMLFAMGLEHSALARMLMGVVAWRSLPKICNACRQELAPSPKELEALQLGQFKGRFTLFGGAGCALCDWTGTREQAGVEAVVPITSADRLGLAQGEVPWALAQRIREGLVYDAGAKALGGYVSGKHLTSVFSLS